MNYDKNLGILVYLIDAKEGEEMLDILSVLPWAMGVRID